MIDLLYFFRKKTTDPASSLRAAKNWISSLPLQDEYQAHRMVVNALNLFNASTEPLNLERLKVLMRFDDSGQKMQQSLCGRYLENQDANPNLETALWKSIFAHYWHLAHGYQAFIREFLGSPEHSDIKKYLPLMTVRALHYFGMEIKWRYFHQEAVHPNMWKRLHTLYRFSETHGFSNSKVKVDADGNLSTCTEEFIKILMLDMLSPTSMKPENIELVEHWLDLWSGAIVFDEQCNYEKHTHFVDFANGEGAGRLTPDISGAKQRYWSIAPLLNGIEKAIRAMRAGTASDRLGLGAKCRGAACLELLEQVAQLWMRDAPTRVHLRENSDEKMMEFVCGIEAILASLDTTASNDVVGRNVVPSTKWPMENESDSGYGLNLDAEVCKGAAIGKLVGLRPDAGDGNWMIGAVRWLTPTAPGKISIGVEKLSNAPRVVTIERLELPQFTEDDARGDHVGIEKEQELKALFLPKVDFHGMASSLILPTAEFTSGKLLDLQDKTIVYKIRLTAVLEKAEDWSRVKFDILGRRSKAF